MKRQSRHYVAYRKVYNWMTKYVVILFICALFGLCSIFIYLFAQSSSFDEVMEDNVNEATIKPKTMFMGRKYVHLDLKGAPPKVSYYEYLFPLLSKLNVDGVVVEYEDMFPYDGALQNISAFNSYSKGDIKYINKLAKKNNLEIIPLVQTFGHLEFVLKLQEYKHLREVPEFPEVICPSKSASMNVLFKMLSQMIDAHPDSSKIHIGADETRLIGRCKDCIRRKLTDEMIYIEHIRVVRNLIAEKRPDLQVLFWDDQIREISLVEMQKLKRVNGDLIPVVWHYESDIEDKLEPGMWRTYSKVFPKVWIASAFKGASGVNKYIVDLGMYTLNHRSWMRVLEMYGDTVKFASIVLTGWQRYDHFAVLCELLPVALPSLAINLEILNAQEEDRMSAPHKVSELFACTQPYALMGLSFGIPNCHYPGGKILDDVYRLHQLNNDFEHLEKSSVVRGWLSRFNTYFNVLSPEHVFQIASQMNHFESEIDEIEIEIEIALLEIYDVYTKNEWMTTYVEPLKSRIKQLSHSMGKSFEKDVWPRRPFNGK